MNIAILSDRLLQNGGTESYLLNLIDKYLHQGDNVTVFTTKLDRNLSILKNEHFRVVSQSFALCPKKLRFPFYYNFLRQQLKNQSFDFVLGINSPYCPDVGVCCGTYLGDLKASSWERKINPLNYVRIIYEKKKYTSANHMVAHSHQSKRELIDLYDVPPEKINVIYPVPALNKFKWKSKESVTHFRNKHLLSPEKTYFLFSSTGHKRKGLQIIIDALKLIDNRNIVVLVAGSPRGSFKKLSNIEYLGYVKNIHELYQACDSTLLPSTYEPFGLAIVESLLSGTPVIISKKVGAKDLVKPSFGTILDNLSATDLAKAMMRYTHDNLVTIDKPSVYKQIEPYINHHLMIKELAQINDTCNTQFNNLGALNSL